MPQTAQADSSPATVIRPSKFAHVVYRTTDLPGLRDWYQLVLGARVIYDDGNLCFMTYDDEHHRIAIVGRPDFPARPDMSTGVDHVAYTYDDLADLVATYERLKAAGIEPFWCINHGITLSMYFRDPDGNQVELQIDLCETEADLRAYLEGPFQDNPIGVNFDPDDLVTKFRGGTPAAELLILGAI